MSSWREIPPEKASGMRKILTLLVDFDERTGRYLRYRDPEAHFARRSLSVAEGAKFYLCHLGDYVYLIVGHTSGQGIAVTTSWVHEDGIRQERETSNAQHPVHGITCVTDLWDEASEIETGDMPSTVASLAPLQVLRR